MYRLYYRQEGKRPEVYNTTRRRASRMIATLPTGTEWELYRKGLFSSQWRLADYGVIRPTNVQL